MDSSGILNKIKGFFTKSDDGKIGGFYKILRAFSMDIYSTKKSRLTGIIISAALLLTVILDNNAFISQEFRMKWVLLAFCLLFPFAIGALITFNFKFRKPGATASTAAKTGLPLHFCATSCAIIMGAFL